MISSQGRGYRNRTVPVSDLRLRRWATIGFIIASFAGLVSFLGALNLPVSVPLLYILYIGMTIYALRFTKVDMLSPLNIFILFSFLGFGIKLPLIILFPERAYFTNPFYSPRFSYDVSVVALAFAVFLCGYIAFFAGFQIVNRGIRAGSREGSSNPLRLAILSGILIIGSFYYRSRYLVGVPGIDVALIEHAGYIYYPLRYGALVVTSLALYSALKRGSIFYLALALILFGASASAEMLLGWRGGLVNTALTILIVYHYVARYHRQNVNRLVRRCMLLVLLLMIVLTLVLYPIVSNYRYIVLIPSGQVNLLAFGDAIRVAGASVIQTLDSLVRRASGLDNLIPIVGYFYQGVDTRRAFFLNLFGAGIQPEQFYTSQILGVSPNIVTTSSPTSWGALYIFGGIISVVVGLMLIGMVSKLLYLTFAVNMRRDGRWIVFYALFAVYIFVAAVVEGTILRYFVKNFVALSVMCGFFIVVPGGVARAIIVCCTRSSYTAGSLARHGGHAQSQGDQGIRSI